MRSRRDLQLLTVRVDGRSPRRQTCALQHSLGKILQTFVTVRCDANLVEEYGYAFIELARGHAGEAAMQAKKFSGGEPLIEAKVLGKEADSCAHVNIARTYAEN